MLLFILNIENNFIEDQGIKYIAKALEKNSSLTTLNLGD